jgi:hypothetical protein
MPDVDAASVNAAAAHPAFAASSPNAGTAAPLRWRASGYLQGASFAA